jgi:hypothetical protein
MKKYIFLHYGFENPTQEIMDAWSNWFASMADRIVDKGSPLGSGIEVSNKGTVKLTSEMWPATGYMIIKAGNIEEAEKIAKECPIISSLRVYELMSM